MIARYSLVRVGALAVVIGLQVAIAVGAWFSPGDEGSRLAAAAIAAFAGWSLFVFGVAVRQLLRFEGQAVWVVGDRLYWEPLGCSVMIADIANVTAGWSGRAPDAWVSLDLRSGGSKTIHAILFARGPCALAEAIKTMKRPFVRPTPVVLEG